MEKFGTIELSLNEMVAIEGGKALSFYFGYAIGAICGTAASFLAGIADGFNS